MSLLQPLELPRVQATDRDVEHLRIELQRLFVRDQPYVDVCVIAAERCQTRNQPARGKTGKPEERYLESLHGETFCQYKKVVCMYSCSSALIPWRPTSERMFE